MTESCIYDGDKGENKNRIDEERKVITIYDAQGALPQEMQKKQYKEMAGEVKPKPPILRNSVAAFVVGGLICVIGQGFVNLYQLIGLTRLDSMAATSATLIFFAALLTGLGLYDSITKFAGAGGIVPITGFANAMVAPAMEFRTEGFVLGVAARLFTVAGPVLVFGIVSAWIVGILFFIFR